MRESSIVCLFVNEVGMASETRKRMKYFGGLLETADHRLRS